MKIEANFKNKPNQDIIRETKKDIEGTCKLSVLLTKEFMLQCTSGKCESINELFGLYLENSKIEIPKTEEESRLIIKSKDFSDFVKENTNYDSWDGMLVDAALKYTQRMINESI